MFAVPALPGWGKVQPSSADQPVRAVVGIAAGARGTSWAATLRCRYIGYGGITAAFAGTASVFAMVPRVQPAPASKP
jgi:hypothetical protein